MATDQEIRSATERALQILELRYGRYIPSKIGVSRQILQRWRRDKRIGPTFVLLVESHSGISRYELRPDIYGDSPKKVSSLIAESVA